MYELLTGRKPFRGASTADVLDSVLKHDPAAPSSLRVELPRALDEVVARILQKSPEDRYAGWAELALDLARVGRLSVYDQAEGEAKVTLQGKPLDVLRGGEVLGEMAYVRGEAARRQATVEVTKDALVVELPRAGLERLTLGCQLHLARALLRTLADRLAFSDARVAPT